MNDDQRPIRMDYRQPGTGSQRPRTYQLRAWHVLSLIVVLVATAVWSREYARRQNADNDCARNLHAIESVIREYADAHAGRYPDTFADLLTLSDMPSEILVCDQAGDTPATGATTRAVQASLAAGGHLSFVYLGRSLTTTTASGLTVVAYERLGCRPRGGTIALFGDGTIRPVSSSNAIALPNVETPRPTTLRAVD